MDPNTMAKAFEALSLSQDPQERLVYSQTRTVVRSQDGSAYRTPISSFGSSSAPYLTPASSTTSRTVGTPAVLSFSSGSQYATPGSQPDAIVRPGITVPTLPTREEDAAALSDAREIHDPETLQVINDRVVQSLAQMSLAAIPDPFPAAIILLEGDPSSQLPGEEYARHDVATLVHNRTREAIQALTTERIVPDFDVDAAEEDIQPSVEARLGVAYSNKVLDITKLISSGTGQGRVYGVTLKPNDSLHYIRSFDRRRGVSDGTMAVMKKSPIYSIKAWQRYTAMVSAMAAIGSRNPQALANPAMRRALATNGLYLEDVNRNSLEIARQGLEAQYTDPNNDAYVDALGYVICSTVGQLYASPFFPLTYGCYRAYDTSYFDRLDVARYSPMINNRFPVQLTIIQTLQGDVAGLLRQRWFVPDGVIDARRVMALFAQVTFGLGAFQARAGGVHNDLHLANILFESVAPNNALYYVGIDGAFYRIPTYGRVFKLIDFGRSTFSIGGLNFGSTTQKRSIRDWNLRGPSNDLLVAVLVFVLAMPSLRLDEAYLGAPVGTFERAMSEFFTSVLRCFKSSREYARARECMDRGGAKMACMPHDERGLVPYARCESGVPADNYDFFRIFVVPGSEVPLDAIVYPLWPRNPEL